MGMVWLYHLQVDGCQKDPQKQDLLYAMTAYGAEKFTRDADPKSIRHETRRMQGMPPAAQREGLPRDVSALAWPVW